jgi:hypothetical protein
MIHAIGVYGDTDEFNYFVSNVDNDDSPAIN